MLFLLTLYACIMGIATFFENYNNTASARYFFYHAPWFFLLQLLLVVNGIAIFRRYHLFRWDKIGMLLFHISFIVILIGATVTHFWGREGTMQIREGESTTLIYNHATQAYEEIPMRIELLDFTLDRYPGSNSPSSYTSKVRVYQNESQTDARIGMNKILNVEGYRFFQSSFHPDEKGTVLTVNYDFPGMQITYFGYILLTLGIVLIPFQSNSRFRQLYRQLGKTVCLIVLFTLPVSLTTQAQLPVIQREHADRFGALRVQNPKGRLEPVDSWSAKLIRKIHQNDQYKTYNNNQLLLSLLLYPHAWADEPLIRIKNKELRELLRLTESNVSYNALFQSDGSYRLEKLVNEANQTDQAGRSKLQKDILALDEQVNIIFQIQQGRLLPLFPHPDETNTHWSSAGDDLSHYSGKDSLFVSKIIYLYADEVAKAIESGDWSGADKVINMLITYQRVKNKAIPVDDSKHQAELFYNNIQPFSLLFKLYLITGALLLLLFLHQLIRSKGNNSLLIGGLIGVMMLCFVIHTLGIGLRWYISGYAPWSNAYETMLFVAWSVMLIGFIIGFKHRLLTALCALLAGILLFVSSLNWMNPEITPLVPVLQSYWLMLHVAVIMMGYGFFFVCALIGLMNLILMLLANRSDVHIQTTIRQTTIINEMAMICGTLFLALGIFLGAIWANESWGRYWGWDPKETWALITMITYAVILHARFIPRLNHPLWFNMGALWSVFTVLMTYFGVNYYLSGLHSYGAHAEFGSFIPIVLIMLLLSVISFYAIKKEIISSTPCR